MSVLSLTKGSILKIVGKDRYNEEMKKPPIKYVPHKDYGLKKLYNRMDRRSYKTMTKWGVYFEMDTNEWMWDNGTQQIGNHIPPLLFDTKEEAEERAKRWNTGTALEYPQRMIDYWKQYEQERAKKISENIPPEF